LKPSTLLTGLLLICIFLLSSICLGANSKPKVLLVTDPTSSNLVKRLKSELAALGFIVSTKSEDSYHNPPFQLEKVAKENEVDAAVRIVSGNFIEVWVVDTLTQKIVFRRLNVNKDSKNLESVVALGAVELLRASFLEVNTSHSSVKKKDRTEAVQKFAKTSETENKNDISADQRVIYIDVGASILFSAVDSAGLSLAIAIRWQPLVWFDLGFLGDVPLSPLKLESKEGDADVSIGLLGFDWRYNALSSIGDFQLGIGTFATFIEIDGRGKLGYVGKKTQVKKWGPYGVIKWKYSIRKYFGVFSQGMLGRTLSKTRIVIVEKEKGNIQNIVALTLGLEVSF